MKKVKSKLLVVSLITYLLPVFSISCGGDEKMESKSMSQIQAEEGVPVQVKVIEPVVFTKELSFFAKLRGIKEATEGAKIGGRVEKINYKVGDYVKKGSIVVEFPADAPGAMYEQSKSAYENSLKNYERAEALLAAGETSQSNYDAAETQYLVNKSNYETQKQRLFIEAPFDGIITEILVNEKDNVQEKISLFSIAQLNKLTAKVWANEEEIKSIKNGMSAYIENGNKQFEGKVTEVAIKADPATQAFYAELEFDNPELKLKSGVTADIKIRIYENKNAMVIPRNIINEDESGEYIFTAENGKAVKRNLEIGFESDINVEIIEGLQPGDRIIIKGTSLTNNAKIKVIQ